MNATDLRRYLVVVERGAVRKGCLPRGGFRPSYFWPCSAGGRRQIGLGVRAIFQRSCRARVRSIRKGGGRSGGGDDVRGTRHCRRVVVLRVAVGYVINLRGRQFNLRLSLNNCFGQVFKIFKPTLKPNFVYRIGYLSLGSRRRRCSFLFRRRSRLRGRHCHRITRVTWPERVNFEISPTFPMFFWSECTSLLLRKPVLRSMSRSGLAWAVWKHAPLRLL